MRMRCSPSLAGLGAALVLAAAPALGAVDMEVDPNVVVKGTFDSADEVETFRFEASRGAVLSLAVAAKKKAPLDLDLTLHQPDDATLDLSTAPVFKDAGTKVIVKKLELAQSGTYTLEVRGGAAGEYALKLAVAARKKWAGATPELAPDATTEIAIGAPRGSRLGLKAKPDKGSDAAARWVAFGPTDLTDTGKVKPTSHATGVGDSGDALDVAATLANRGAQAGAIAWTIVVKAPRVARQKLDVRGAVLGSGGTSVARTVPAASGGTVEVEDGDAPILGAAVVVPPGALSGDARVSIATAPDPGPPDPSSQLTVGAPFALGPAGLTFSQPVDVWVPFDPAKLPDGVDPMDLQVRKVSASGSSVLLPVVEVDGERVRVQVTSFSTFVPFTAKGTPRLEGTNFWNLFVELEAIPEGDTNDSRDRAVFLGMAAVTFGAEGISGGLSYDLEDREVAITHDASGNGSVGGTTTTGSGSRAWSYGNNGRSVVVSGGTGGPAEWQMNVDGTILALDDGAIDDPLAAFDLMLRRPTQRPTTSSLAGKYWFAAFGLEFTENGSGPAGFGAFREFGEFTFRSDGTFSLSGRLAEQGFDSNSNTHPKNTENDSADGTFSVQSNGAWDGTVEITLPGDEPQSPEVLRFFPESGGRLLVGSHRDSRDEGFLYVVAVRQSAGLKLADLAGSMRALGMEFEPRSYVIPSMAGDVAIPDIAAWSTSEDLTFAGGEIESPGAFFHGWERDPLSPAGLSVTNVQETEDETIPFNLRSTGFWSIGRSNRSEEVVGAFSPDGSFGFLSFAADGPDDLFGISFFFEQPPARP